MHDTIVKELDGQNVLYFWAKSENKTFISKTLLPNLGFFFFPQKIAMELKGENATKGF